MRLSDLLGKEVVNLLDGSRLGVVGDSDLVIDNASGQIESIILPHRGGLKSLFGDQQELVIPWEAVRRIGSEVIIVELDGGMRGLRSQFS
ncbi:MAG: YlmC/YmxH family sporulation protein [Bacillota bacterium]